MNLTGIIVDKITGAALPGATLSIDSTPIGVSDAAGHFSITTAMQGENFVVSYVGYTANSIPLDQLSAMYQIPMTLSDAAAALDPVTVTPTSSAANIQVSSKPNILFPLVLAGGALFLLTGNKKRKRVSGTINTTTLLLAGGAAVAVYLLTRPRTNVQPLAYQQAPVYNPAYLQSYANQGNQTAQDITAGGNAAASILTAISHL